LKTLTLPINGEYFKAIRDGEKLEEYRLFNKFWKARLEGKTFDRIVLTWGYPHSSDTDRRLVRAWRGWTKRTITHKHFFESAPTEVYAIDVSEPLND
jgi:hypothetical protein